MTQTIAYEKFQTVLESALPYTFFTESFSDKSKWQEAPLEFINPAMVDALGLDEAALGKIKNLPLRDFIGEIFAGSGTVEPYLSALQERNHVRSMEVVLRGRQGQNLWVHANSRIIEIAGAYFVQGIFVNIDYAKVLEGDLIKEKKTLEMILSGIGDAVCLYDRNCKVIFQSSWHKKIFGENIDQVCIYADGCDKDKMDTGAAPQWLEKKVIEKGKERFFTINAFPVKDEKGAIFARINIARDMTAQIELEAKNRELERMRDEFEGRSIFENIVGRSQAIKKVYEAIQAVAELETTVLIQGDTGTGKELAARAIHQRSLRHDKSFIAVNCGALPEPLLESELFGHAKGAFTGAISDKIGLFQEASGGTLFLDEIGEMSPATQVKLLRVLQEGEIRRVGSTRGEKVDTRVLAATNRNLKLLTENGQFREDLFYRLNVFPITMPPLTERNDDILLLADHFLKLHNKRNRKEIQAFSKDAHEILLGYHWPGNVRELANVIERAIILAKSDTITARELPLPAHDAVPSSQDSEALAGRDSLQEISRKKIDEVLQKYGGNKIKAAKALGISRATLWRKLKQLEL